MWLWTSLEISVIDEERRGRKMPKVALVVHGKVQGVGFRWGVHRLAVEMENIYGRVWNNDDGTVGIHAQSDDAMLLKQFIAEVKNGPTPMAKVTHIDITVGEFSDYTRFIAGYN